MTKPIPHGFRDLLVGPVVVSFVTMMPDGTPQATPVWCDYDGEHILINTAKGRQKHANVTRDPHVAVLAIDPANPYRWLEVRGTVTEVREDQVLIDKLARVYTGAERYYGSVAPAALEGKETRVTIAIRPEHVNKQGEDRYDPGTDGAETTG